MGGRVSAASTSTVTVSRAFNHSGVAHSVMDSVPLSALMNSKARLVGSLSSALRRAFGSNCCLLGELTVTFCHLVAVLDICLECEALDETVDAYDSSGATSLSSRPVAISSDCSSGIDLATQLCVDFVVSGLMHDHGGDSTIRSRIWGSETCASHYASFFATHGFCVHRSLEKYALHACVLDSG